METFENYKDSAIWYLKHDSKTMFKTYTKEQSIFIIELFFKYAISDIIILSGIFPEYLYMNNETGLLKEVINRFKFISGKIRIITLNNINKNLEDLAKSTNGILEYRKAYIENEKIEIPHFMVVDGKRYRLEDIHEMNPQNLVSQICCNDIIIAKQLTEYFNSLWEKLK